jgi:hypothetical protein
LREKVTEALIAETEEDYMKHASCLLRQGVWTHFLDVVRPFDLSWSHLISVSPKVVSFVLNAQINSCRTPDMLKLWGYSEVAECPLCSAENCTLHHILVNCTFSLNQGRYSWRHDSVLSNLANALEEVISDFNAKRPISLVQATKMSFKASFVRKGYKSTTQKGVRDCLERKLLDCSNDWQLLVDLPSSPMVFPPEVYNTPLRPDIVIWSKFTRIVILLELSCCAEEGIRAAQLRKESRYCELVNEINASKMWKAQLFTLEVGARGLVGTSTHRILKQIGFSSSRANSVCKALSWVVSRCSYAIFLAQKNLAWCHGGNLLTAASLGGPKPHTGERKKNIVVLRENGIKKLYHFTDVSNLSNIRVHGLLSWKALEELQLASKKSSSVLSRALDDEKGLGNFVRLSFCRKSPMLHVALKENRIERPVILEIDLEVVSRPGVLFCEKNAASSDALPSSDPRVVNFDVVKSRNYFSIPSNKKHLFQAEVLVPTVILPHLIKVPKVDSFGYQLMRGQTEVKIDQKKQEMKEIIVGSYHPEGIEEKPRIPRSVRGCKDCASNKATCVKHGGVELCDMPLSEGSKSCEICQSGVETCLKHMRICRNEVFIACCFCFRFLCSDHREAGCCPDAKELQKRIEEAEKARKAKEEERRRLRENLLNELREHFEEKLARKRETPS